MFLQRKAKRPQKVPRKRKLPDNVVDTWPDIFDGIDIEVVPVNYLDSVRVLFKDGKIWDINVKKSRDKPELDIEKALDDLFNEYEDHIENIDFRLDTVALKKDVQTRTRIFMKKRK